jgi:23S rRNA (pseudouridine1915-N3)-methyltransferase
VKLHILAFGKIGRCAEAEIVERYLARITWKTEVTELDERAALPPALAGTRTVLLDERGDNLSSEALAARLSAWRDGGVRTTRFVVGPADGHCEAARSKADLLLAFGAATWPHMLARAMLAEQLYRATSILAGHPYHRG